MNAKQYLQNIVAPAISRLEKEPDSSDLQISASILLFHAIDYLAEGDEKKRFSVICSIRNEYPDFDIIHGAVNALKHFEVKSSPRSARGLKYPIQGRQSTPLRINGSSVRIDGKPANIRIEASFQSRVGKSIEILKSLKILYNVIERKL